MTGRSIRAVVGLGVAAIGWLALAASVAGASPSPTGGTGADPRSPGQGPGLVGDPLAAVLLVLVIGIAAVGATLVYLRLTARRGA